MAYTRNDDGGDHPEPGRIQICYRTGTKVVMMEFSQDPRDTTEREVANSVKDFKYSENGSYLGVLQSAGLSILAASNLDMTSPILHLASEEQAFTDFQFSGAGKKVVTFAGRGKKMCLYDIISGNMEKEWVSKTGSYPQWTDDDSKFALLRDGVLSITTLSSAETLNIKHETPILSFSLSPKLPYVSTFTGEKNGGPAMVRVFQLADTSSPILSKTFFRAEQVHCKWNAAGSRLLVTAHTEVDATGKSYYGESRVYYMSVPDGLSCRVPLEKDGHVHDAFFSGNGADFVVIYGFMPACVALFDRKANLKHNIVEATYRNTGILGPDSKHLCLGGFGNLAGDIDIWNLPTGARLQTSKAPLTTFCEWLPTGNMLMTATLSPRLRVDNGFKIWTMDGRILFQREAEELFRVNCRPMDYHVAKHFTINFSSAKEATGTEMKQKSQTYVPPSRRGKTGQKTSDSTISSLCERETAESSPKVVDGKKGQKKASSGSAANGKHGRPVLGAELVEDKAQRTKQTPEERKIKNLRVKLRQIQELREKEKAGETLQDTQLAKIQREPDLIKQLVALGVKYPAFQGSHKAGKSRTQGKPAVGSGTEN